MIANLEPWVEEGTGWRGREGKAGVGVRLSWEAGLVNYRLDVGAEREPPPGRRPSRQGCRCNRCSTTAWTEDGRDNSRTAGSLKALPPPQPPAATRHLWRKTDTQHQQRPDGRIEDQEKEVTLDAATATTTTTNTTATTTPSHSSHSRTHSACAPPPPSEHQRTAASLPGGLG
ncbi:hypothetical protein E2C01_055664 [Portunus trituberculatus]|uniref:Uncharacterized protein n=1 Tax=Portunus trituberculatus TaxID=210409 RepID=A0A5B7GN34_PORTR|nr:hypothetical protein [Portunus trituberculatus]